MMPMLYDRERKLTDEEGQQKALNMLEMVGLGDRTHHQPQELSGGQQQRVAIARALINDPVLIIADEPTGNLDSHSGREILNLLRTLHQQGVTIVMVTHDPITAEYTQRVIHLADGKIDKIKHNGHKLESTTPVVGEISGRLL
jgi:putative ABC transport system ATP-binding protein